MSVDASVRAPGSWPLQNTLLVFIVSVWLTLFMNGPFWLRLWEAVGGLENDRPLFLATLPVLVCLFNFVVLGLLFWVLLVGVAPAILVSRLELVPSNLVGAVHSYAKRQLRQPSVLEPVGLAERIGRTTDDTLIVLHMLGTHGPAYYKRYPQAFRRFTPACETAQLDKCDQASIVNAYDNTILYTDHVLGRLVDLLEKQAGHADTAMLYVSDHGESLGEKGVYLHGLPYAMAPDEQTRVPMVAWLSPGFTRRSGITSGCLREQRESTLSHDNLFHSMLGLMGVRTAVYRAELDLFRPCAGPGQVAAIEEPMADNDLRSAP